MARSQPPARQHVDLGSPHQASAARSATAVSPRLYNEDLAPARDRNWRSYNIFAMWMADVHNLGNYTFAAGLFVLGLTAWQVFASLLIGFLLIFVGMNWMGLAGQKTGIPFPVFSRISFGIYGANLPALIRAIVAIAWYGIQTYLASVAIDVLVLAMDPSLLPLAHSSFLGLSTLGWIAFLALWVLQAFVLTRGMEAVRTLVDFAGPVIWVVMIGLAIAMVIAAKGHISLTSSLHPLSAGATTRDIFAGAGLTVAMYSTLMLNFCDFSRFAPSKRSVVLGNFLGLPINSVAFALLSVIITASSVAMYGKAITDPALLLAKTSNTALLVIGAAMLAVATIGINVVANFVSPAYDLANLAPRYITFKRGGMISAVIALVVLPWNLYSSPAVVNGFLGTLGAFLGPLFGIMIVDYYLVRKGIVDIASLYQDEESGAYFYRRGVNPRALASFLPAAALAGVLALDPAFAALGPFSWFVGTGVAALIYRVVARPAHETTRSDPNLDRTTAVSNVGAVGGE